MFVPKHFEITDTDVIYSFIKDNAFGQLISTVQGRLVSTHIPFLLSEDKQFLFAHVAKKNPQHLKIEEQKVMITLEGAHDYISPSWYASPGVPTWNYQTVHIYGSCETFDNVDQLKIIVDSLTDQYESSFEKPWIPDYKASMLNAIIGLKIKITDIKCQFKLSQNKASDDQINVAKQLKEHGNQALANAMLKYRK